MKLAMVVSRIVFMASQVRFKEREKLLDMSTKQTASQVAERLLYFLAVATIPSIPLFFLYSRNSAQGLLFKHFLIFGGVLAVISIVLYLLISKFALRRRRTVILITIFWAFFWFFDFFRKFITRGNPEFSQTRVVVYLLAFTCVCGFVLRFIKMNRTLTNIIAFWLCVLFAFNFVPEALAVSTSERQRANNEQSGELPYKIKTEFHIDPSLPHPNIYWLHMDGMMGFDAVERYFGDSQAELKNELAKRGFVINESARLGAGYTAPAVAAMTSPDFYDSFLAEAFAQVSQVTHDPREHYFNVAMRERGFSLYDIFPQLELVKVFSDAGFTTIAQSIYVDNSENIDIRIDGSTVITDIITTREANIVFDKVFNFKNLVVNASALSAIKPKIDELIEMKRPMEDSQPLPEYPETVSKYVAGDSDSDGSMESKIRGIKYATSVQSPHFFYCANLTAHGILIDTVAGDVTYEERLGWVFLLDENGNFYKERLDNPYDVHLYLPQYKYAAKQMIAQLDTIIENDPNAIIVIQGDHGIHVIGIGSASYNSKIMYEQGYSLVDQVNMTDQVISAVRIPPQYGKLTQPLDPLDITRYLVNNFVGAGNYDYLFYKEEDEAK